MGKKATLYLAVLACLTILAVPASAGILDGNPDAIIAGSTAFANNDLNGYLDWAVFKAEDLPITPVGWTPTAGELVYAYQVFELGTDYVSSASVPVHNESTNIGDFPYAAGEVAPDTAYFTGIPGEAYWTFHDPSIAQGESSTILAFSSPNLPINGFSILVDGGTYAIGIPVPTPGAVSIPEPGTCTLLLAGLALLGFTRFTRQK
ncbi:MAG: PEP-CTERM sorting domain-containing protein [Pirellulales bacterium]|nr:PEP-CTERM sorting domain-containing protein [Pirellulales bacterium]